MVEVQRIRLQCESLGFQTVNNELIFFFPVPGKLGFTNGCSVN